MKTNTTVEKPQKNPTPSDAIALLKQDHRDMEKAFKEFEKIAKSEFARKKTLADQIGSELLKHMTIEEEIFYPAVKEGAKGTETMVNEGVVEHAVVKDLIRQIQSMSGKEELFHTKVMVMAELVEHHVKEEEDEMFPKVKKSTLDLLALGEKLAQRKRQLN